MKKEKLIEEDYPLVKSRYNKKGKLYDYEAWIVAHAADKLLWSGYVVARSRYEAYEFLNVFIRDKFALFNPRAYDAHISEREHEHLSKKQPGVYDN